MIPKKIHYCWLSGEDYPPLIKHCIETWHRILPDYELILWDTNRFDIKSVDWVREAFEARKYAFAADFIRFYAVYSEGGIYLDSDVEMVKPFDDLLDNQSFIGFEASTGGVEAAIFGAEPGKAWCRTILDYYKNAHFIMDPKGGVNGKYYAPGIVRQGLNATYTDFPAKAPVEPIVLDSGDMLVCPPDYFSPLKYDIEKGYNSEKKIAASYRDNPRTYCIHRFNAAWGIKPPKRMQVWELLQKKLKEIGIIKSKEA